MTGVRRLGETPVREIRISDADAASLFDTGLEYAAPARGTWNIVHTGMLIPEAHEIFVCAQGCLRGVVLTAAEMGAEERFSTVAVRENNVTDGDLEDLLVEGVTDILEKLPKLPPAVLVYTSCIHHFMGADLGHMYAELRARFPGTAFADCYMNPIMRKSGLTPDQLMRRQLYGLLDERVKDPHKVLIAGNDFASDDEGDYAALLRRNGLELTELPRTRTWEEYQALSEAAVCVTNQPAAIPAGKLLQERFGMTHLHLPFSFAYGEIAQNFRMLCGTLGIPEPDHAEKIEKAEAALAHARSVIGEAPVEIDYTAFSRPLSLARLLIRHDFRVARVYLDGVSGEERGDFEALKTEAPDLLLSPTVHPVMRVEKRERAEKTLAVGQKAAYFAGTPYFVNIVENGGYTGFDAVTGLASLMEEAWENEKDTRSLIGIKGMGCGACL
jgi:hypothetical protein